MTLSLETVTKNSTILVRSVDKQNVAWNVVGRIHSFHGNDRSAAGVCVFSMPSHAQCLYRWHRLACFRQASLRLSALIGLVCPAAIVIDMNLP